MKEMLKYLFYDIICPLLLFFSIDKLLRGRSTHQRLIIMYHGINRQKNFSINGRHLPANEFEKHLKYFKKNFDILSLKELCDDNNFTNRTKHSIALTFDDGYLNNVQNAIPLMLKYKVPAIFFVSTVGLVDNEYLHPPDYIDVIRQSTSGSIVIDGISFQNINKQLINSNHTAYDYVNSLNFKKFKDVLSILRNQYPIRNLISGLDSELYTLVSAETVSGLIPDELFTVGSHSHDHVNLSKLSKQELEFQLGTSKKTLERHTHGVINSIAFPYGYFNKDVVECSSQQGYKYLIAGGSITDEWKNRVFPRIGILNMAGYSFNMLSINRGFSKFGF